MAQAAGLAQSGAERVLELARVRGQPDQVEALVKPLQSAGHQILPVTGLRHCMSDRKSLQRVLKRGRSEDSSNG